MSAEQIYFGHFDRRLFALPAEHRRAIEAKIDEMGRSLRTFPHYRLTGSNRYRLRVGEYRIIYTFDATANELYLLDMGHRREIYR